MFKLVLTEASQTRSEAKHALSGNQLPLADLTLNFFLAGEFVAEAGCVSLAVGSSGSGTEA
jgi:hypothetical protein